jgi:hypothetical protein
MKGLLMRLNMTFLSGKKSSYFLAKPYNILTQMKFEHQKSKYFKKHEFTDFN